MIAPARTPLVLLALLGAAIATYLTLYQWRVTSGVWDPIFGSISSEAVLTSSASRMLPLPDATLGASAYLVEAAVALFATTQPWRVLLSVVLVGLALTSLALVLVQILLVHALCTLCLCSAAISWLNAWLGRHEILATIESFN